MGRVERRVVDGANDPDAVTADVEHVDAPGCLLERAEVEPLDPAHADTRLTVMERYWQEYRRGQTPEGV